MELIRILSRLLLNLFTVWYHHSLQFLQKGGKQNEKWVPGVLVEWSDALRCILFRRDSQKATLPSYDHKSLRNDNITQKKIEQSKVDFVIDLTIN